VEAGGDPAATLAKALQFLLAHPASSPPAAPVTAGLSGRTVNQMVDVPGGQLRVRRNLEADGRTVIVQHDAAGSSDVVDPVSRSLIGHRPVLAVDLPGHGESDNTIGEEDVTVARYQAVVQQCLDTLGLDVVDFYGMWGGGLVGLEMAVNNPGRVKNLVMSDLIYHSEEERRSLIANYTPLWEPVWYGGHLLMIWHMMRDQGLFWPWFRRERAGILRGEPYIDPAMVNGRVLEVFKAPVMWRLAYQSHFTYPTHERLQAVKVPTLLCAPAWDPNYEHTTAAHAAVPHTAFKELPAALHDWGPAFLDFMDN
jgi:pimeloyl-ACP methyl ester carboxylesterase